MTSYATNPPLSERTESVKRMSREDSRYELARTLRDTDVPFAMNCLE